MNATNPPPAAANPSKPPKKQPAKPSYPHFVDFAEKWLLPLISVRLAEGQRENTYTWCEQWWEHRPVAVRIAHLHAAFEASRGPGASAFVGTHVDAHFRVILDAAKGPLHRCTPREHIETPWLPSEPVPADKTGPPPAGESETTPPTSEATDKEQKKPPPPPRFAHHTLWVRQWLLPVTAVRISGNHRENTYTWCTRWFEHHGVELRFALLHRAFEAAVIAEDKTAMSSLFTRQIDPAMRLILDAANGPLHRCKPGDHQLLPSLGSARVPRHWFGPAHARIPTERLGFAPDFRAYRTPGEGGIVVIEPTQRQAAVLEALQNHTVAITELLTQATKFDGPAPQSWLVDYHHHAVARTDLATAAAAGGVPPVWIEHVQARGERGIAYRPEMYLREPDPTDWDRVLGDLTTDVTRLREWAGLDVAHRDLAPDSRAAALRTNIEALRMRTAGVANLLGLDAEEGELLWGDTTVWAQEVAATLAEVPAEQITHRWHAAAETDTRNLTGQATALSLAGIAVDTAAALPSSEELYEAISAELDPVAPLFVSARGAEAAVGIDAAVAAALPQDLDPAVAFSHPAEPEPVSGYDPSDLEAVPLFLSADGAEL